MKKKENFGKNDWADEDDAPPLDEAFFNHAKITKNGVVVQEMKRGRSSKRSPEKVVSGRSGNVKNIKEIGKGAVKRVYA